MSKTSFEQEIRHNQAGEAPPEALHMEVPGASMDVRLRGAFLLGTTLTGKESGDVVAVLHAPDDVTTAKLTASHTMSPVGPSDGLGGQHGFPRWSDYHHFGTTYRGDFAAASLQAKSFDSDVLLAKRLELSPHRLDSTSTLFSGSDDHIFTSLGEHYYFQLDEENFEGLTIDGMPLDGYEGFLDDNVQQRVQSGKAVFTPLHKEKARIHFPAGHDVELSAMVLRNGEPGDDQLGMLVWHKPGSESVCFEPVVGFNPSRAVTNWLHLPHAGSVALQTTITLL